MRKKKKILLFCIFHLIFRILPNLIADSAVIGGGGRNCREASFFPRNKNEVNEIGMK